MIYDGIITKPPLEEVVEHGWLKDQAAKVHKYLDRWRGKNGKWYYRYKSKAQEQLAKAKRAMNGYEADEVSDSREGHSTISRKQKAKEVKKWRKKGVYESYKNRKSKIASARKNADRAYRSSGSKQYKVRQNQVKQGRANASSAYKDRISNATSKAKSAYKTRKTQINLARGNAHRAHGKKTLGVYGYQKAMGGPKENYVLDEYYQTVDGKWVKKKKR